MSPHLLAQANNATQLVTSSNSSWLPLANTYGANWQLSGLPPPPWDLRITGGSRGEQLIAR